MPVSAGTREQIRSHLDGDDEIRYVFPAGVLMSVKPSVFVVVSRKAITVLSTGMWSTKVPRAVVARLPRKTVLGPIEMQPTPCFTVAGIVYEIDDEYVAVVNAADAEITAPHDFPPDPLPDL